MRPMLNGILTNFVLTDFFRAFYNKLAVQSIIDDENVYVRTFDIVI